MAVEPLVIFARTADPARVAVRLRELCPDVDFDGPDDSWGHAVARVGRWPKKRTITFKHDPSYYAEPNWSGQLSGMQGYFSGFPETDRKQRLLMLISTFRFVLATEFAPDYDHIGDPRLEMLFQVTGLLDGVIFTPSSMRDRSGRILFGAGGTSDEDPGAVWPQVVAEVSIANPARAAMHDASRPRTPDSEVPDGDPPNAMRVARRALVLTAVAARSLLERESNDPKALDTCRKLFTWVRDLGIREEFEGEEREVLIQPPGQLDRHLQIQNSWRLEGLVVLAWSLGLLEIPPHDESLKPDLAWRAFGLMNLEKSGKVLENPLLRPRSEIGQLRNRLFALHWRLRNFDLNHKIMDFEDFARTCWFGPLDLSGLPLVEGDLGIRGDRIDRAPEDVFDLAHSIARERHQAANWLWEGPQHYSGASVST